MVDPVHPLCKEIKFDASLLDKISKIESSELKNIVDSKLGNPNFNKTERLAMIKESKVDESKKFKS